MSGDDKTTAQPREAFSLKRWSRVKRGAARATQPAAVAASDAPPPAVVAPAAKTAPSAPAPEPAPLPSVETLTFDSDFTAFLGPQVDEGLRREALKKLFSDPRFNVMDGLDVYIDDYTKPDPLAPDVARALAEACSILEPPAPPADATASASAPTAGAAQLPPEQRDAAPASAATLAQADPKAPSSEAAQPVRDSVPVPRADDAAAAER